MLISLRDAAHQPLQRTLGGLGEGSELGDFIFYRKEEFLADVVFNPSHPIPLDDLVFQKITEYFLLCELILKY